MENKSISRRKLLELSLFSLFLLVEIPFYIVVFSSAQNKLKLLFYSVFAVFIFCLFVFCLFKKKPLILLGITFTMFADAFLEILDKQYQIAALIMFIIAQTFYFVYLISDKEKKNVFLLTRFIPTAIITILIGILMRKTVDTKSIFAVIYFCFLLHNVVIALVQFKKFPLFAIGLILFALCDLCLGLSMVGDYINSSNGFIKFLASIDCWIFYLPSQVVIAASMIFDLKIKKA